MKILMLSVVFMMLYVGGCRVIFYGSLGNQSMKGLSIGVDDVNSHTPASLITPYGGLELQ